MHADDRDAQGGIPPGWDYNPATWPQRLPIVGLALVGTAIASYLAAYQYRLIDRPWDPFFPRGVVKILDSNLSYVLPIPDAALGALAYLADAVAGVIGGTERWRTMPWIVVLFAILVGPLGVVSVGLVMSQPVIYGAWCTLCLASAVVSALMIGPAMDEAMASLQYLKRVKDRGRVSWWRAFWGLEVDEESVTEQRLGTPGAKADELLQWHGIPLTKTAITAQWVVVFLGIGFMAAPWYFDYAGTLAAGNDRIVGPLVATFAMVAAWEATRHVRRVNIVLGVWLVIAPWVMGHPEEARVWLSLGGALIAAFSLVQGRLMHNFGGGWSAVWQKNPYGLRGPKAAG